MNALFFNQDYIAKYYNCSGRTYEEWKAMGHPNVILGFIYAFIGVIFLILLLPFMVVFIKSDFMKYSCYKIMFFIGVIDCIQIPIGGFYFGYAAAVGMVYCMAPITNYVFGDFVMATWCSGSSACMLLAINRCIDLINPKLGRKLFGGKKTIFWLIIPIAYFIYFLFFYTTIIFNSNMYASFFDPFFLTPERNGTVDHKNYPHTVHAIHNISVIIVLLVAYSALLIHLYFKVGKAQNTTKMSKIQRQTFMQCTLICIGALIASFVYVYMQFLPTPIWVVISGELCWQLSHGAAGVSYAFFNTTMRKELVKIFCFSSKITPTIEMGNSKRILVSTSERQFHMEY